MHFNVANALGVMGAGAALCAFSIALVVFVDFVDHKLGHPAGLVALLAMIFGVVAIIAGFTT